MSSTAGLSISGAAAHGAQNSWFSPPKTSLTERSLKMLRIASVSMSAQESWRMLRGAPGPQRDRVGDDDLLEARRGEVLERGAAHDGVRGGGVDGARAGVEDGLAGDPQRRRRVDDVVDDDRRLALDVADDVADLGDLLGRALLVEDREVGAELGGELLVELHAAGVRRDDDEVAQAEVA